MSLCCAMELDHPSAMIDGSGGPRATDGLPKFSAACGLPYVVRVSTSPEAHTCMCIMFRMHVV